VEENERRDMCLRNLRQFVKQDDENQTAWLDLPENGWWYWWHDPIETQAAFLKLLCAGGAEGRSRGAHCEASAQQPAQRHRIGTARATRRQ